MLYKFRDAALVIELVLLVGSFISDCYSDARVKKCFLTEPLRQDIKVVFYCFKNLRIRLEGDLGAAPLRLSGLLEASLSDASDVLLLPCGSVSPYLDAQPLRKEVHN